jgi:pimeloyl-ACP methyl ester carboxylesterase
MMDTITLADAQLSALTLGTETAPPLLLLHGLVSGNMASWYSGIAPPLAASHRVILYDQRGHGGSTLGTAGFDLESQTRDLEQVLAHYDLATTPIDLAGHSMGALIALHFALRAPQRMRRLVLIDAPMPACDFIAPSLRGITSREALAQYIESQMADSAVLKGRRRERLYQRLAALFFESSLLHDVLDMQAEADAELAALDIPVLLLYGQRSPCLAAGRYLQARLPQAQLQLLDGGHYLLEETPGQVSMQMQHFLSMRVFAGIQSHKPHPTSSIIAGNST